MRPDAEKVYIAGPYTACTPDDTDRNIEAARKVLADLFRAGYTPFCPHSMTARFERDYPDIDYQVYVDTDLEWLKVCDYIYLLPGWERSAGSLGELRLALATGIRVFNPDGLINGIERLKA